MVALLAGMQAPLAGGADAPAAGATTEIGTTPKVARPASGTKAAQSMPAALEKLVMDFQKARAACAAENAITGFVSHAAKRGESAKTIIRRYWADLPLREDLLATLVHRLNPEAHSKGTGSAFKTGALLAIPSADFLNTTLFKNPDRNSARSGESNSDSESQGDGHFAAGWVHFP